MISDKDENNGWQEWRHHIISELKRLNGNVEKLEEKSSSNLIELSKLKVYAVLYGGISGTICAIIFKEVIQRW